MANLFWVGAVNNLWSNGGNWDLVSGGPGGAGVPGPLDVARFSGLSPAACEMDMDPACDTILMSVANPTFITNPAGNPCTLANGLGLNTLGGFDLGTGVLTCLGVTGVDCSSGLLDLGDGTVVTTEVSFNGGTVTMPSGLFRCLGNFAAYAPTVLVPNGGIIEFDPAVLSTIDVDSTLGVVLGDVRKVGANAIQLLQQLWLNDLVVSGGNWDQNFSIMLVLGDLLIAGGTLDNTATATYVSGNADLGGALIGFGQLYMDNPAAAPVTLNPGAMTFWDVQIESVGNVQLTGYLEVNDVLLITQGVLDAETNAQDIRMTPGGPGMLSILPPGGLWTSNGRRIGWIWDPVLLTWFMDITGGAVAAAAAVRPIRVVDGSMLEL